MSVRRMLLALACIALTAAAPGDNTDRNPGGYAVRLHIRAAAGGGVQRLELPAAAIVAMRNRDGTDVRVFDDRGRAVPIARIAPTMRMRRDVLAALPILGAAETPVSARVSVRFDERGRPRMAEVASAGGVGAGTSVLGVLFDARRFAGDPARLELDADIPPGQPIRFTIEASPDLDTWRTIGARVLYRAPGAAPTASAIALGAAALDRDYLRVTWAAGSRLIAPVSVRRAVVLRSEGGGNLTVEARLPALVDDHSVEFVTPASPLASLRLFPAGGDGPIPVRVLGRNAPEQPWMPLADGMAAAEGSAMDLAGATPHIIRIEADRRGTGFTAPPKLQLRFRPQAIAFVAYGAARFTLAAGRERASDALTSLESLSAPSMLPQAALEAAGTITPLELAAPDARGAARRQWVLWAVLLAAVLLLGGLIWLLTRRKPGS